MIVLALSSGTSVDGIDVAVADVRLRETRLELTPLRHADIAYSQELRADILAALPPASTTMEQVCRIDTGIGQEFAAAAQLLIDELSRAGHQVDLIVSHGQTLFHWVESGQVRGTLQLGQPAWIAEATGLPVISDVRAADVAAGGQGAPLAGLFDQLLLTGLAAEAGADATAALNLGGIANVTVVTTRDGTCRDSRAFDTGPANALLDAAMHRISDGQTHIDQDGQLASTGSVDSTLLHTLRQHPFYAMPAPKSTGKEHFNGAYLDRVLRQRGHTLSDADLMATLVELTATTVAAALAPWGVSRVLAAGGGTANPSLMRALERHLAPAQLLTTEEVGVDPGAKEAYLFAVIGFLSWHGLPGTVPGSTGATHTTVAGQFTPGATPLHLPKPGATAPTHLVITDPTKENSCKRST